MAILDLLHSLSPLSYRPGTDNPTLGPDSHPNRDRLKEDQSYNVNPLQVLEKVLEEEITFYYYLNVRSPVKITTMGDLREYYAFQMRISAAVSSIEDFKGKFPNEFKDQYSLFNYPYVCGAQQRLDAILDADEEIRNRFSNYLEDIISYQTETLEQMKQFLDSDVQAIGRVVQSKKIKK
ncbi:MAG TPA: hypothetical protein VGQ13_01200 [Nitrososphaera sp.]|nr:hypothetical protein [Nitrososphaera sp.]